MDKVSFDAIGPGQSGRLVYQVLGKNGPIPNPSSIRYLPVDNPEAIEFLSSSIQPIASQTMGLGLAGANLMCSAGTLLVSAYTAKKVAALTGKVNQLISVSEDIKDILDRMLEITKRIDIKVAENNLRHALNHIIDESVTPEGVSLSAIAPLIGDLENFAESLDEPLLFNFSVKLSSDVRKKLSDACSLLHEARRFTAFYHNLSVSGDPEKVVLFKPERDYFFNQGLSDIVNGAILHDQISKIVEPAFASISSSVKERFFMAGDHDQEHYSNVLNEKVWAPIDLALHERDPYGHIASLNLPQEYFNGDDLENVFKAVYSICEAWLFGSDAGLIHRISVEIAALDEGYENSLWPHLIDSESSDTMEFKAICEFSLSDEKAQALP